METVCSNALRRNDAMLVPRHASPISCILHGICDVTEGDAVAFDSGESHVDVTQYGDEYIDAPPGGDILTPLVRDTPDPGPPSPPTVTGGSDCAIP